MARHTVVWCVVLAMSCLSALAVGSAVGELDALADAEALMAAAQAELDEPVDTEAVTPDSGLQQQGYEHVARAHDSRPEPVPPPRPQALQRSQPQPPPAPVPTQAQAAPASLVATASSTSAAGSSTSSATSTSASASSASAGASVSTVEPITHYNEFLARNYRFAQSLTGLFRQLATTTVSTAAGDKTEAVIDVRTDLPRLVQADTITQQHANVIASWDLDGDHYIRENEWTMGPLWVSMLQYNPLKRAEFERLAATGGDTAAITQLFARMAQGKCDVSDLPRFTEMQIAPRPTGETRTEEEEALDAEEAQNALDESVAEQADDTARFAARHGRRRRHKKKRNNMTSKAARKLELLAQKRPKSKHGIPSEADEHCVLCQFLVQRIQKQLYFTLSNSNDAYPADPNADIPAKKMRQVNAQLLNRRGGKGMLRILAEDIVSDMCEADQMPELYYSACRKIDKKFPILLDAIYFQFHSEAVCEEANLCGKATYFNQPTSVHLPSKSLLYNSGRGKCGLMGGARERANAFISAALCFASQMFVETSALTNAHS